MVTLWEESQKDTFIKIIQIDFHNPCHSHSWLWYFSAWNFKTRYTKLDCPYGKNLWNLSCFYWYYVFKEIWASEAEKVDFSKNEAIKFWELKLNFWEKTDYKTGLISWNWWNRLVKWPNLESDNSKKSKFSKFRYTAEFHTFLWRENTPCLNFSLQK